MCESCRELAVSKTCGHIHYGERGSIVRIKMRDNERHFITETEMCDSCIVWHAKNNLIIRTKEDEDKWMKSDE